MKKATKKCEVHDMWSVVRIEKGEKRGRVKGGRSKRKYGKEAQTIKREELQKRRERLNKEYQLFSFGEHRPIQKKC